MSALYSEELLKAPPAGTELLPTPSKELNDRVALLRRDITSLAVDAIVNAANSALRGGGGVDGAIHGAAGYRLAEECRTLGGCPTGSAKVTNGYDLHCRKVIHAVGPIYDGLRPDLSEELLGSCYSKSLQLAVENGCKTVAFPAISTGIYGYPSAEAAVVAISAVREFLEKDTEGKIEKVIFVNFVKNDADAYIKYLP